MSLISSYDPRYLEEMRRREMMYGAQPPVGMAASAPPAPMPQLRESSPLELQRINQAGGVGQQFSPVMQPTPQSSVNAMFQPPVGGMQQQIGGMTQGNVVTPPAPESTSEFMAKMSPESSSGSFNSKALGKALSGAFKSGKGLYNQEIKNIGLLQQAQAPQMGIGAALQQPQQKPGISGAMQAITGGIGSQPQMLEMLKRMRR